MRIALIQVIIRGISVCSCLGKLFTLVINERLLKFIEEKNILSYNQIGFRTKYRTADHIFVLNTILNSYFSKGKKVYTCFVDFPKHMTLYGEQGYSIN